MNGKRRQESRRESEAATARNQQECQGQPLHAKIYSRGQHNNSARGRKITL